MGSLARIKPNQSSECRWIADSSSTISTSRLGMLPVHLAQSFWYRLPEHPGENAKMRYWLIAGKSLDTRKTSSRICAASSWMKKTRLRMSPTPSKVSVWELSSKKVRLHTIGLDLKYADATLKLTRLPKLLTDRERTLPSLKVWLRDTTIRMVTVGWEIPPMICMFFSPTKPTTDLAVPRSTFNGNTSTVQYSWSSCWIEHYHYDSGIFGSKYFGILAEHDAVRRPSTRIISISGNTLLYGLCTEAKWLPGVVTFTFMPSRST
jgi:hypothetical protein